MGGAGDGYLCNFLLMELILILILRKMMIELFPYSYMKNVTDMECIIRYWRMGKERF